MTGDSFGPTGSRNGLKTLTAWGNRAGVCSTESSFTRFLKGSRPSKLKASVSLPCTSFGNSGRAFFHDEQRRELACGLMRG